MRKARWFAVACVSVALGAIAAGGSAYLPSAQPARPSAAASVPGYGGPVGALETTPSGAVNELEAAQPPRQAKRVEGSFIVALAPGQSPDGVAQSIARDYGGEPGAIYDEVINGFQFLGPDDAGKRMASDPRIRSVQPDYVAYAAETTAATHLHADDAPCVTSASVTCPTPAWYTLPNKGAGVRVAILDTGADLSHPDITNNIDKSASSDASGGVCNRVNGSAQDLNGHGTRTVSNAVGLIGVAPQATAVVVKVFPGSGTSTTFANIACGVNYIVHLNQTGDHIVAVNASIAGSGSAGSCSDGGLHQAVCDLVNGTDATTGGSWPKAAFFAAAGNSGTSAGGIVPARFPETIAVSAFDCDSVNCATGTPKLASFSNRGSTIDLGAPGVNVLSAKRGGGHETASGTSRSSPQATGAAADLVSAGVPVDQLKSVLQAGGRCPTSTRTKNSAGNCTTGTWPSDSDGVAEPFVDVAASINGFAPPTPTAPSSPTNVTAVAGNGQATVSWAASNPNGSAILKYTVTSNTSVSMDTPNGSQTSLVFGGLTNGVQYTFTVKATNGVGTSAPSASSGAVTPHAPTVPGAPTGVSASAGNGQATVSWTAPVDNGGSPITKYTVTSSSNVSMDTPNGSQTSLVFGGLTNGVQYTFTVKAVNAQGPSASSSPSNPVTPAAAPLTWTRVEDTGAGVAYSSGWSVFSAACTSGGKYHDSQTTNATATFTFTGVGVRLVSAVSPALGNISVWVDNQTPVTINSYNATQTCNLIRFEKTGLTSGSHVLNVKVLGTKDPASSGTHAVVDAFEYQH